MSERATTVGTLIDKLVQTREWAQHQASLLEQAPDQVPALMVERIAAAIEAQCYLIGGLCDRIAELPDPEPEVDEGGHDSL